MSPSFLLLLFFSLLANSQWIRWPNKAPDSIPFEQSTDIIGWEYLNNSNYEYGGNYHAADTWFPSWAYDGNLYTPWTDGTVYLNNGTRVQSSSGSSGSNWYSTTGFAIVSGDNASNLTIDTANTFPSSTYPYRGRYPCGSLYYNNTWFYGTYTLNNSANNECGNWCVQGPFVGFRWSTDKGNTWNEPKTEMKTDSDNIFHETVANGKKVKFGAPHVVDFGQNLQYSNDNKMYIIAHGSNRTNAHESWMQGDSVYMARVDPNIESVNDTTKWEFYDGNDAFVGGYDNADNAKPLFTWLNQTGVVTMTYFNILKKYIMTVSTPTYSPFTNRQFDTYFLESDNMNGPWKYIVYMSEFGPEGYFVNHPSKFLDSSIDGGYYNCFLSYSANFAMDGNQGQGIPSGSGYHWSLQQSRFVLSSSFQNRLST